MTKRFPESYGRGRLPAYLSPVFWPPAGTLADRKMEAARKEVTDLIERLQKARAEAEALKHEVDRARQADREAHAAAIRAGKPEPKPSEPKAQAAAEKAAAVAEAVALAAEGAAQDALTVFDERGPTLAAQIRDKDLAKARQALVDALAAVADAARAVQQQTALTIYLDGEVLESFERVATKYGRLPRPPLVRTADEPTFTDLLGALQAAAADLLQPPEAERPDVGALRTHPARVA